MICSYRQIAKILYIHRVSGEISKFGFKMKKPNKKLIDLQIKENIRLRKYSFDFKNEPFLRKKATSNAKQYTYINYPLPECIDIHNKRYRTSVLKAINAIKYHTNESDRPYFDFSKVQVLTPMAMIHFKQLLEKHAGIICRGRPSPNTVVTGMLTKLNISKRLGIKELKSDHKLVEKWYYFSGENTDLGEEYDEIENVLIEKFGEESETFDVINTAIGEAVINVVNHAYSDDDKYKKWYLFLSITPEKCNVVISDLGMTIPNSIPTKISDNILQRIFNINSWGNLTDDSKIEIATQYQKTATKLPNRGKGFQDMKAVCDQVHGSIMMIHSKGGYWAKSTKNEEKFKKQNYKSIVNGTIISWLLPLDNSTLKVAQ